MNLKHHLSLAGLSAVLIGCLFLPVNLPAQEPPAASSSAPAPASPAAPSTASEAAPAAPEASTESSTAAESSGAAESSQQGSDTLGTTVPTDTVVQYDEETNSVIVITDAETNREIAKVVSALDKPVPQVLIKVLFLEVTHSKSLDLGVEGSVKFNGHGNDVHTASTDFGVAAAQQGGFYNVTNVDFQATLRALATTGKLEVLSRPSVLARNNETATITIGQEVPFITNSRITDAGQTINTVQYQDIGIILDVTPHISAEKLVEMDVSPEISTLTADTVPISDTVNAPVIAKRSAQTRVVVADGKTCVIGGLMEDNDTQSVNKVPILGDIPLLGMLFKRTITNKTKTELLIFLTPYVVDTANALDTLSQKEMENTEMTPEVLKSPAAQRKYGVTPSAKQ